MTTPPVNRDPGGNGINDPRRGGADHREPRVLTGSVAAAGDRVFRRRAQSMGALRAPPIRNAAAGVGGTGRISSATPASANLTLRPLDRDPAAQINLRPAPTEVVRMGTKSGNSFCESNLDPVKQRESKENLTNAFNDVLAALQGIDPSIKYLDINLDTLLMTSYSEYADGRPPTQETSSAEGLKARHPQLGNALEAPLATLRHVATMVGLGETWSYKVGSEVRGSVAGGMALRVPHYLEGLPRKDLNDSMSNEKQGITPLLNSVPDPERVDAGKRIIQVEAFLIAVRKKFVKEINDIGAQISANPPLAEAEIERLQKKKRRYAFLHHQMEQQVDRYALYWAAAFKGNDPGEDAKKCLAAMKEDLYRVGVADIKEEDKPPKEDFYQTPQGKAAHEYAVDAAAMLLSDSTAYKSFYALHDMRPKNDHINFIVLQACFDSANLDFNKLTYDVGSPEEQGELRVLFGEAQGATEEVGTAYSGATEPRPEDRFKKIKENKDIEALLFDPRTNPTLVQRLKGFFTGV